MELIPSDNVVEPDIIEGQITQVAVADLRTDHLVESAMVVEDLKKTRYIAKTPGEHFELDSHSRHRET